jgi:hypothetical protein
MIRPLASNVKQNKTSPAVDLVATQSKPKMVLSMAIEAIES